MDLVQASDAIRLSGLTAHQLREWCGRRAVVAPDVPAAGRGRHALFSWQTILSLRVLNELHDRFGIEIIVWRPAIGHCQKIFRQSSFPALWGTSIVFPSTNDAVLVRASEKLELGAHVALPLDPHLRALALDKAAPPELQLPLFAAIEVRR
ncbi:MerR family transcriptional regulator [Bradyrhizobium commune]|uniref:MerR family transcriptional regulator n=1 Tax=Bradyrhizobium commune TaxID=83627 RepID=A0A7S9D5Y9_9BRAD|nr:MerR family transcriptional regulator [Bradyrhizobium commune]